MSLSYNTSVMVFLYGGTLDYGRIKCLKKLNVLYGLSSNTRYCHGIYFNAGVFKDPADVLCASMMAKQRSTCSVTVLFFGPYGYIYVWGWVLHGLGTITHASTLSKSWLITQFYRWTLSAHSCGISGWLEIV